MVVIVRLAFRGSWWGSGRGGLAVVGQAVAVSSKKSSSSPAPSPSCSSSRTCRLASGDAPDLLGRRLDPQRAVRRRPWSRSRRCAGPRSRAAGSSPRTVVPCPASRDSRVSSARMRPRPMTTSRSTVACDLGEQVARQQHRAAAGREVVQEHPHPADALGVHAVGRLVEDQHGGVAHQRRPDAEPLAHAERVVADAALAGAAEADPLEHLRGPRAAAGRAAGPSAAASRCPVRPGCWAEASSITPTTRPGFGCDGVRDAVDGHPTGRRRGEPGHHPQGGGLAGAVRAEEAGDRCRVGT